MSYRLKTIMRINNAVIKYDNTPICKPISFEINRGDAILLNGKNGSGKSSLLKLLLDENIEYEEKIPIPKI